MSDESDARTTRLILVPGTWGRGFFKGTIEPEAIISEEFQAPGACSGDDRRRQRLRWFEPGSEFREKLANGLIESKVKFTTRVLLWNGHNSIGSRNEAAIVLANVIRRLAREAQDDPIVVIAHSHGGNLALRAVHMVGTSSIANLKVVTLATPFVQIYAQTTFEKSENDTAARKEEQALDFLRRSWMAVLGAAFLIGLMALAVTYQDAMRALLQPTSLIDPFNIVIVAVVVAGLLVGYRLSRSPIKLVVNPRPASSRDQGRHNASLDDWTAKPERLAKISQYSLPQAEKDWLLVLRGVDDEASLTLAAGAIGNRVAHFMLGKVLPATNEALALICGFLSIAALAGWIWEAAFSIIFPIIALGFAAVALLAAVISFLPGIFRSVYGRELLFGSWRCEIAANSSPDSASGVQVKTLLGRTGPSQRKLRHALYMNAEVPSCILEWLKMAEPRRRR
jgi:Alpha/beta hydrolase family